MNRQMDDTKRAARRTCVALALASMVIGALASAEDTIGRLAPGPGWVGVVLGSNVPGEDGAFELDAKLLVIGPGDEVIVAGKRPVAGPPRGGLALEIDGDAAAVLGVPLGEEPGALRWIGGRWVERDHRPRRAGARTARRGLRCRKVCPPTRRGRSKASGSTAARTVASTRRTRTAGA